MSISYVPSNYSYDKIENYRKYSFVEIPGLSGLLLDLNGHSWTPGPGYGHPQNQIIRDASLYLLHPQITEADRACLSIRPAPEDFKFEFVGFDTKAEPTRIVLTYSFDVECLSLNIPKSRSTRDYAYFPDSKGTFQSWAWDSKDDTRITLKGFSAFGKTVPDCSWSESLSDLKATKIQHYSSRQWLGSQPFHSLMIAIQWTPGESELHKSLWKKFLTLNAEARGEPPMDGLAKAWKASEHKKFLEQSRADDETYAFVLWLMSKSKIEGVTNNAVLAKVLETHTPEKLVQAINRVRSTYPLTWKYTPYEYRTSYRDEGSWQPDPQASLSFESQEPMKRDMLAKAFPVEYKQLTDAAASKKDWTRKANLAEQADSLGLAAYPLLDRAVRDGDIPIGVFHQPDAVKTPVNIEYSLWEECLAKPGWAPVLKEIAQNAAARSTYGRDITAYLSFLLWKLPAYLDRHAPRPDGSSWSCLPTFVSSEWQLEMEEATETGTVKKRSAFTPVADNLSGVVTVPYVAVSVSGVRTQWCYSKHYYVLEQGMIDPESGSPVLRDLEEKLNGRDDYGLCYYTLDGTTTARGYPSFLIIFERLGVGNTRVHFHRVRPNKSKDGQATPASKLIYACYQYMAGNIPASEVGAQQGDLMFIPLDSDPTASSQAKINPEPQKGSGLVFESHRFEPLIRGEWLALFSSEAKEPKNRLGFLKVPPGGLRVKHPEHLDIDRLEPGWYDVRRCKSFEASPKGIWSLTID